ncbi:hypothetical protein PIB30_094548 [Stylosanthes scabra]|uniref:Uncharacterized protein n=1 Tax=Stylosanthes scabra TaxID=79078 RepID=A0ABU6SXT6_9FABA|nr:hypothetical protein [Stylosanthes scabra]
MEEVKQLEEKQEEIYNHNQRFHSQIWQEQEKLAKEIQEVQRSQLTQTLANNKRLETERNMQLALERQGRDIVEMRKQLNLWTRNTSAREAYTCWAHQQANPNLSEIPITQIPDIMQTNAEKGRPMFSNPIMELPLLHKLIQMSRFHCGQHLLLPVFVHLILHLISHKGNRRDKPIIEFDLEIEKTMKKNQSRVKAQRALQFDQVEANSE